MKRIFKKNQIIIAALAVMIAAAGYLNYSGRLFSEEEDAQEANADLASQELLDISEEDLASASGDIESQDSEAEDGSVEGTPGEAVLTSGEVSGVVAEAKVTREQVRAKGTPGEAVLTSGEVSGVVAEAKVTREQVRAKNKESLLEIIDNENLSDEQKQEAVNQMVAMTEIAEKEAAAETLLASKGFSEAVVSLTDESADVVVNAAELSDANRAQIEDIVTRKTGVAAENVVITPVYAQGEEGK